MDLQSGGSLTGEVQEEIYCLVSVIGS